MANTSYHHQCSECLGDAPARWALMTPIYKEASILSLEFRMQSAAAKSKANKISLLVGPALKAKMCGN